MVVFFGHPVQWNCDPDLHLWNQTNMAGWKITIFNRKCIFKWSFFHCHVSFRGVIFLYVYLKPMFFQIREFVYLLMYRLQTNMSMNSKLVALNKSFLNKQFGLEDVCLSFWDSASFQVWTVTWWGDNNPWFFLKTLYLPYLHDMADF